MTDQNEPSSSSLVLNPFRHHLASVWPPDRVKDLTEQWLSGASALQIATQLGTTRSAVMGKIFRLRNKGKLDDTNRVVSPARRKRRVRSRPSRDPEKLTGGVLPTIAPMAVAALAPIEGGISIMELEGHHCRAITGKGPDGLARYCGAHQEVWYLRNVKVKTSYCDHHNEVYHNRI